MLHYRTWPSGHGGSNLEQPALSLEGGNNVKGSPSQVAKLTTKQLNYQELLGLRSSIPAAKLAL